MGYTQDYLPLNCSVHRAMRLLIVWALTAVALAQSQTARVTVFGSDQMALELRANTVRIEALQEGFGFIVGERSGYLYIATARHVLTTDLPDAPPVKVKVYFYSDQATPVVAEMLGPHDNDLGLVRVPTPKDFVWQKDCLARPDKQVRGTPVWFIGRTQKWYVPVHSGAVVSDQPSTRSQIELENLQVAAGTSGAPLVAETGLVGIIQNDSEVSTLALTVDFIQRAFMEWNYPWDLTLSRFGSGGGAGPPPAVNRMPTIEITKIPPKAPLGDPVKTFEICGKTSGADRAETQVVVYARTNYWYVQPDLNSKSEVKRDGTWCTETHPGARYAALLVRTNPDYKPDSVINVLPSKGGDILATTIVEGSPEKR